MAGKVVSSSFVLLVSLFQADKKVLLKPPTSHIRHP
jgi:hypothetical protein